MTTSQDAPPSDTSAAPRPVRRALVVLALLLVIAGVSLLSGAFFADETQTEDMSVTVGRIDIATAPVSLPLDVTGLVPGDVLAVPLEISNSGSLRLRYALSTSVLDPVLGSLLRLEVRTGVTSCDPVRAGSDGSTLSGPLPLGGPVAAPVLGDPAMGADAGDRELAAGASEQLCLRIELPAATTEAAAAGLASTVTVRVDAEQTAANP